MAENWSIRGEYLVACNCRVSPCPCTTAGGDPTEGECFGMAVLSIGEGRYEDADLSGLHVAFVDRIPGNILDGNWDFACWLTSKRATTSSKRLRLSSLDKQVA